MVLVVTGSPGSPGVLVVLVVVKVVVKDSPGSNWVLLLDGNHTECIVK